MLVEDTATAPPSAEWKPELVHYHSREDRAESCSGSIGSRAGKRKLQLRKALPSPHYSPLPQPRTPVRGPSVK